MATSDLQYKLRTLLPNASFTLFAPTNASLFALDMIQMASSYIDTLCVRVIPLRPPIYLIQLHITQISLRTVSADSSLTGTEFTNGNSDHWILEFTNGNSDSKGDEISEKSVVSALA